MLITFVKITFWGIVPVLCIYYRVKKKINTSTTILLVLASFLMGLILIGTFQDEPLDKLIEYLNQDRLEEAKTELKYILQRNPGDIKKIDKTLIINLESFNRIKRELHAEYVEIAEKIIKLYKPIDVAECNVLLERQNEFAKLENAGRLLRMADSIGDEQTQLHENLGKIIKTERPKITRLKEQCK